MTSGHITLDGAGRFNDDHLGVSIWYSIAKARNPTGAPTGAARGRSGGASRMTTISRGGRVLAQSPTCRDRSRHHCPDPERGASTRHSRSRQDRGGHVVRRGARDVLGLPAISGAPVGTWPRSRFARQPPGREGGRRLEHPPRASVICCSKPRPSCSSACSHGHAGHAGRGSDASWRKFCTRRRQQRPRLMRNAIEGVARKMRSRGDGGRLSRHTRKPWGIARAHRRPTQPHPSGRSDPNSVQIGGMVMYRP